MAPTPLKPEPDGWHGPAHGVEGPWVYGTRTDVPSAQSRTGTTAQRGGGSPTSEWAWWLTTKET